MDALFPPAEDHVSSRARHILARLGVETVGELAALDLDGVASETWGMGLRTVSYLRGLLSQWAAKGGQGFRPAQPSAIKPEPQPLVGDSLGALLTAAASSAVQNQRNLEVWRLRTGLASSSDGRHPTLEEVAEQFGLTRERIRQIEMRAERRVRMSEAGALLTPILEVADTELARCLGVCPVDHLSRAVSDHLGWKAQPNAHELSALLRVTGSPVGVKNGLVQHPDRCVALARTLRRLASGVAERFSDGRHVADFAHDLASSVTPDCLDPERDCSARTFSCGARDGQKRVIPEPYLRAVLVDVSPAILDGDRVWPPQLWPLYRGSRKRDVVRAALHCLGRPVHFSDLTRFIREQNRRFSDIRERDVHACLTSYAEFIPVGRGMYAIAGVAKAARKPRKHVTTAQAVVSLLRKNGKPMPFRRIVEALKPKGFREPNIFAALTSVRQFVEVGYRVYALESMVKQEDEHERKAAVIVVDRLAGVNGSVVLVGRNNAR